MSEMVSVPREFIEAARAITMSFSMGMDAPTITVDLTSNPKEWEGRTYWRFDPKGCIAFDTDIAAQTTGKAVKRFTTLLAKIELPEPEPTQSLGKTLGAQMAAQEAERERKKQDAAYAREQQALAEYEGNKAKLERFIRQALQETQDAVTNNRPVKKLKMSGYGVPWIVDSKPPSAPGHPFHHVYRVWDEWGRNNDLELVFEFAHDGVGMTSWYEVSFVPRVER